MAVKHAFSSGKADGADTSLVRPSNWNADHTIQDIPPDSDAARDLGSSSLRWRDIFASSSLRVGTNPATTGAIRLANSLVIKARNNGNTQDLDLFQIFSDDKVYIGGSGGADAGTVVRSSTSLVSVLGSLEVGTTPATAGVIRIPNAQSIQGRNAANTVNRVIAIYDSDDIAKFGDPSNTSLWLQGPSVDFRYATTALGGGAAPTVGTIGGTGPTTAAQNSWLKILNNGTASFIPVWR